MSDYAVKFYSIPLSKMNVHTIARLNDVKSFHQMIATAHKVEVKPLAALAILPQFLCTLVLD